MTNTTDPTFINCLFTWDENFRNALSEYRKGKNGGIYKPPNPFDASARIIDAPKAGECSYEELFNFVVPYLQAATFRDILSTETIEHKKAA